MYTDLHIHVLHIMNLIKKNTVSYSECLIYKKYYVLNLFYQFIKPMHVMSSAIVRGLLKDLKDYILIQN